MMNDENDENKMIYDDINNLPEDNLLLNQPKTENYQNNINQAFHDNFHFPSNINQINQKNEDDKKGEKKEGKKFLNKKNRKPKKNKKLDKKSNQKPNQEMEEDKMETDDKFFDFINQGNNEDGDRTDLYRDIPNVDVAGANSSRTSYQTSENYFPEEFNGFYRMSVTEKTNEKTRFHIK